MTSCEYSTRLDAYHDGELSGAARLDMERHVAQCAACRDELRGLEELRALVGSVERPQLPAVVKLRLHRRVDAVPVLRLRHMAEAVAAVAAAVLIVCSVALSNVPDTVSSAQAMPVWESQVIAQPTELTSGYSQEAMTASWMVQDLSAGEQHD